MSASISYEKANKLGKHCQLCWNCKNAIGGCSWSDKGEPVDGWDATFDTLRNHNGIYENTYAVFDCPLFAKDTNTKTDIKNNDGAIALVEAIFGRAKKDYIKGDKQDGIKAFFRSQYFELLTLGAIDGEKVIEHLEEEYRAKVDGV